MAHFAKVVNGVVEQVIVISNEDCGGGVFPESEQIGRAFIEQLAQGNPDLHGDWYQTSYNTHEGLHYPDGYFVDTSNPPASNSEKAFRKNFARVGYRYDAKLDEFVSPEPVEESVVE